MGDTTQIAWTDSTWNPWQGCHKVSEACANCYMYRDKKRYGQDPATVVRSSKATFNRPLTWKEPRKVFTCSWSDFFIEEADAWRAEAWDIIRRTPHLTYQILTKRPERIAANLPSDWGVGWPNVWLGVTGETQSRLNLRVLRLLRVPAVLRFVSVEPMLDSLSFRWAFWDDHKPHPRRITQLPSVQRGELTLAGSVDHLDGLRMLDWVIVGCESGPNSRETKLEWVNELRDQCVEANVPFFLKQLIIDGKLVTTPELDGRRWTQFPD